MAQLLKIGRYLLEVDGTHLAFFDANGNPQGQPQELGEQSQIALPDGSSLPVEQLADALASGNLDALADFKTAAGVPASTDLPSSEADSGGGRFATFEDSQGIGGLQSIGGLQQTDSNLRGAPDSIGDNGGNSEGVPEVQSSLASEEPVMESPAAEQPQTEEQSQGQTPPAPTPTAPEVLVRGGSIVTTLVANTENLIVNGSFEDLGNSKLKQGDWGVFKSLTGWNSAQVDTPGAAGVEVQRGTVVSAQDGTNYIELDSHNANNPNSYIYQDVTTEGGEHYILSFSYSPRDTASGTHTNDIEVWWDGQKIATLSGDQQGWTTYSFDVGASDDLSRLEFRAAGSADTYGGFLDNVALYAAPSAQHTSEFQPNITIEDADSTNLLSAVITTSGFQADEALNIPNSNLFTVVTVENGDDFTVTITAKNGAASADAFEAFLNGISFSTTSDTEGDRSVSYQVTDAEGNTSDLGTAQIHVSPSYDIAVSDLPQSATLGSGDDFLHLNVQAFDKHIDMGAGTDTVRLGHGNMTFGSDEASYLKNIEILDAKGAGNNKVSLSADDVLDLTDGDHHLTVLGQKGDALTLTGDGWSVTEQDADFTTYTFNDGIHQAVVEVSNLMSQTIV